MNQQSLYTPGSSSRQIDSTLPDRYPRGWHCLGPIEDFVGRITPLECFGTKIVAWCDEGEKLQVLNAHCPHMGADLSLGHLNSGRIVCPFHNWEWGGDGYCKSIPYCDSIPREAKTRNWHTMKQNGLFFIWHDHEGNPPIPEQDIPSHPCADENSWSNWFFIRKSTKGFCREFVDNLADVAHFLPVHHSPVSTFINISKKHVFCQMVSGSSDLIGPDSWSSVYYHYGPGYAIASMCGNLGDREVESAVVAATIPVTFDKFLMLYGIRVKKHSDLNEQENAAMTNSYVSGLQESFYPDLKIIESKVVVNNPLLCKADGPLHVLRRWYNQFYVNAADVDPGLSRDWMHVSRSSDDDETRRWIFDEHGILWQPKNRAL